MSTRTALRHWLETASDRQLAVPRAFMRNVCTPPGDTVGPLAQLDH